MIERERRLDLARTASDWSWEADGALQITQVCDRFTGATGRPSLSVVGRGLDGLGALSDELVEALERRELLRGHPVVIDPDGRALSFRLSGMPRFDAAGDFLGYIGTAVRGRPATPPDSRDAFLSNVGHEFRTPLNAIIGFAEVMNSELFGPLSDRYADYARDIAQAGRHLLALIEDVLDTAANEGDRRVSLADCSVDAVVDRAMRIASVSASLRAVSTVREDGGKSFLVRADERRFTQILVNLLVNAIKFSPEGGGVTIAARGQGDFVEVSVSDDGPGIAPSDQHRIFEKFEQVAPEPFAPREGAGLGLAIARDFATAMGGWLTVESTLGEGARFTLALPMVP